MRQIEKLDKILCYIYENRTTPGYYSIKGIFEELSILYGIGECWKLGKRLEQDGYVSALGGIDDMSVEINTYGIDYVENNSYSKPGVALTETHYHISVTGSTNTSIISNSTNTNVHQSISQAGEIIEKIIGALQEEEIDSIKLNEIYDCLNEINEGIENNGKPRFAFKSLLGLTGDISSIAGLIISLGQIIGVH